MSELSESELERLAHIRRPSDIDRIPDLLDTIAARQRELDAANSKLAELEGIDKACDFANEVCIKLQADLDAAEAKLDPAPCGKPGHTMADWQHPPATDCYGISTARCMRCLERDQVVAAAVEAFREKLATALEQYEFNHDGDEREEAIALIRSLPSGTEPQQLCHADPKERIAP